LEALRALFEDVADRMVAENPSVELGRIFHSEGLKTGGKLFGFVWKDNGLVLKLPAARVSQLIESGEGGVFDRGRGTPLREWVCVWPADAEGCRAYLDEAREFVER
jgi:hypothetical protein